MNVLKKLIVLLSIAMSSTTAFAAVSDNQVFTFAVANYGNLFSGTPTSGLITYQGKQYDYRSYPGSGNYLAVANGEVYLMGAATNGGIYDVGPVSTFESPITSWQAKQPVSMCSASTAPAGFNYSQAGNTITVTTTGCVAPPAASTCNSFSPQATGVNVLLSQSSPSLTLSGITIPPAYSSMINSSMSSKVSNAKTCISNAPAGFANMTLNLNVCLDITQQPETSLLSGIPGVTVSGPITMTMQGTVSSQTVPDCKAGGATIIYDAYAMQAQVKQTDGTWKTLQADGSFK
jgi:hypothetical protein